MYLKCNPRIKVHRFWNILNVGSPRVVSDFPARDCASLTIIHDSYSTFVPNNHTRTPSFSASAERSRISSGGSGIA